MRGHSARAHSVRAHSLRAHNVAIPIVRSHTGCSLSLGALPRCAVTLCALSLCAFTLRALTVCSLTVHPMIRTPPKRQSSITRCLASRIKLLIMCEEGDRLTLILKDHRFLAESYASGCPPHMSIFCARGVCTTGRDSVRQAPLVHSFPEYVSFRIEGVELGGGLKGRGRS